MPHALHCVQCSVGGVRDGGVVRYGSSAPTVRLTVKQQTKLRGDAAGEGGVDPGVGAGV